MIWILGEKKATDNAKAHLSCIDDIQIFNDCALALSAYDKEPKKPSVLLIELKKLTTGRIELIKKVMADLSLADEKCKTSENLIQALMGLVAGYAELIHLSAFKESPSRQFAAIDLDLFPSEEELEKYFQELKVDQNLRVRIETTQTKVLGLLRARTQSKP